MMTQTHEPTAQELARKRVEELELDMKGNKSNLDSTIKAARETYNENARAIRAELSRMRKIAGGK